MPLVFSLLVMPIFHWILDYSAIVIASCTRSNGPICFFADDLNQIKNKNDWLFLFFFGLFVTEIVYSIYYS